MRVCIVGGGKVGYYLAKTLLEHDHTPVLIEDDPAMCRKVADSLDLKKAAKAVGEKSVAMLHQKELLPLTGYVHGGCSPIGMKKQYPTVFHETAEILDTITVSAGKIGCQVELSPTDLIGLVGAETADLTV